MPFTAKALLALLCLALAACSGGEIRDTSSGGLIKRSQQGGPDEFQVIERLPLEIPDSLETPLRAPIAGAESRVIRSSEKMVAEVLGVAYVKAAAATPAEDALVSYALNGQDPADIRAAIGTINDRVWAPERNSLFMTLTGRPLVNPWFKDRLDPVAEHARLSAIYPDAYLPEIPEDLALN